MARTQGGTAVGARRQNIILADHASRTSSKILYTCHCHRESVGLQWQAPTHTQKNEYATSVGSREQKHRYPELLDQCTERQRTMLKLRNPLERILAAQPLRLILS